MENPFMPKYLAVHVVVIAGLVVAVTFQVFQSRALTIRLQALEAASLRADKPPPVPEPPPKDAPLHPEELQSRYRGPEPPVVERNAPPADVPPVPDVVLSGSLEKEVARHVDRIVAEKYGHLPKSPKSEDLEKTLERELHLTASQKERIAALLKTKREESSAIFKGVNPFSGKALQKAMELEAKYDQLIKNELDVTQQAKYDQLKKDGKINAGISIQIEADGNED
jgi:hypothetical protein